MIVSVSAMLNRAVSEIPIRSLPGGHRHRQLRALTGPAVQPKHATELVDALPLALQSEMVAGQIIFYVAKASAVVANDEIGFRLAKAQLDVDARRIGMFERVGQRLEADAQEVVLLRGIEAARLTLDPDLGARHGSERHLLGQVRERAREVAALERERSEIHHRPVRLFEAVSQHLARDVERLSRAVG